MIQKCEIVKFSHIHTLAQPPDSTEDVGGSSESVSCPSGRCACGDAATEFNDPEGGKNG